MDAHVRGHDVPMPLEGGIRGAARAHSRAARLHNPQVDYRAVDFDCQSRKEIVRRPSDTDPTAFVEEWHGGYIFENEWQSFRTRKQRELELVSAEHRYDRPGRYLVAVKVIDIFVAREARRPVRVGPAARVPRRALTVCSDTPAAAASRSR